MELSLLLVFLFVSAFLFPPLTQSAALPAVEFQVTFPAYLCLLLCFLQLFMVTPPNFPAQPHSLEVMLEGCSCIFEVPDPLS